MGERGTNTRAVLDRFGGSAGRARADYRHFVEQAGSEDEHFELEGGGLVRSIGGWKHVTELRRPLSRVGVTGT